MLPLFSYHYCFSSRQDRTVTMAKQTFIKAKMSICNVTIETNTKLKIK